MGGTHRTGLKLEPSSWHPRDAICEEEQLRLVAAQVNMFLSPLGLSMEHVVLSGKQPETCERVWSMPRTNIQAAFCADRDTVWCRAAMLPFSPLAFHTSCRHCSSTLLNHRFTLRSLLEAAIPPDNYSLAIQNNLSIGSLLLSFSLCLRNSNGGALGWSQEGPAIDLLFPHPTPATDWKRESEQPQPPLPLCCSWGTEGEGRLAFNECHPSWGKTGLLSSGPAQVSTPLLCLLVSRSITLTQPQAQISPCYNIIL